MPKPRDPTALIYPLGMALIWLSPEMKGRPLPKPFMPFSSPNAGPVCDECPDLPMSCFARIFEATIDVVAMTDRNGRLLYLNAAGRKLIELSQDADIGGHTLRVLHPGWAYEILLQEAFPCALTQGSWSGETALRSAAGREYPVLQDVLAHAGEDGELEFISTICRDISDRKQKELERIEWANRYDAAIRASGQVVFDWDTLSGDIAYGGEIEKLLGFSLDEMSGGMERLRRVLHPEDLAQFDKRTELALLTRDPLDYTFRANRKDGREIIIHAHGCFFLDRQGQIGRMVGFLKDVTKERRSERAILLANERLDQRVTERTAELAKANLELKKSALRQAAVSKLGQHALAGQSLGELMFDAAETVREMLPCDCTAVLHYDEAEGHFKSLAEIGWTRDGKTPGAILDGQRCMSSYTVQTGEAVVSNDLTTETRFEVSESVKAAGARSAITACIKSGEHPLGVLASFSIQPREFSHDDVSFVQSIANVITAAIDRNHAEENIRTARADAESANRAKSEFLSRMSHELRTPLNAILGFTQLLEMEEHTDKQNESIDHISRAGRNLLDLINEVLDIARLDAGRVQFHMESVDVLELLREVTTFSTPAASKRNISIRMADAPGEASFVSSDRERLKQVLLNLVSNGVKFNQEGGGITLGVARMNAGIWRISVADTGIGIPQEKLARLFVPFERLGTREGGTEGGTGLGLALCQRLITGLGGRIGVASSVGAGSTFWVELPAAEIAPEPLPTQVSAPPGIRGGESSPSESVRKILYIEDDISNYYLLERFLRTRKDVKLISAAQGSIGLELAKEHRPALILLDLNLPDMNGEQVLRGLKADPSTADVRVVAVTGEIMSERTKELQALGVMEILVKPYKLTQITALLERSLAGKN
jgi:PAS domain S-box-containing protein